MHIMTTVLIVSAVMTAVTFIAALVTDNKRFPQNVAAVFLITAILSVVTVMISGGIMGSARADFQKCHERAEDLNRDFKFGILAGCRIETDIGFMPLDNFRIIDEEKR